MTLVDVIAGATVGIEAFDAGRWDAASTLLEQDPQDDPAPAAVAWRRAAIAHYKGDPDSAGDILERSLDRPGDAPGDLAILHGWLASVRWRQGAVAQSRRHAEQAAELARSSGDDRAVASAHSALALVAALDGDRTANAAHWSAALAAAQRCGDPLQEVRIRCNRGSGHLEEGDYAAALDELALGIECAVDYGNPIVLALCHVNRGEVHRYQGRLDDAETDFRSAKTLLDRSGSHIVAHALRGLGDVLRHRAQPYGARAAYEEAAALADRAGDAHALADCLSGLALALASIDLEAAGRVADRAAEIPTVGRHRAVLAQAWVSLARGDHERAACHADAALTEAGRQRDRRGIAEALEVMAIAVADDQRDQRLHEAMAIWSELGDSIGVQRAGALRALTARPRCSERRRVMALHRLGQLGTPTGVTASLDVRSTCSVRVRTLGGFEVTVDDVTLGTGAWPSKKARDLLKLLVARRGRRVSREGLIEVMWPDSDGAGSSNRLSVALSTLRAVLDPDHRWPGHHYVGADTDSIWIVTEHVSIDVDDFLDDAYRALEANARGDAAAVGLMADAVTSYDGDVFDGDNAVDWADPLREEARAVCGRMLRVLAADAERRTDTDSAVQNCLRLLAIDPFDEEGHLGLVRAAAAAGRHGEARRLYARYQRAMEDLGVFSAAYPSFI